MTAKIIAHRGYSDNFPENTQLAFDESWKAGFDGIELDIQVTKDAKVIVTHDPETGRISDETYIIKDTDWDILKTINVGQKVKGGNESLCVNISLLSDIIEQMPANKIVQIEIKHQIENMEAVIADFTQLRKDIEIQIISFDPDKLLHIRQALPHLDCLLIIAKDEPTVENPIEFAVKNGLVGLDVQHILATKEYIMQIHDNNLKLGCWTVNDKSVAKQLSDDGMDFIASDNDDSLGCL